MRRSIAFLCPPLIVALLLATPISTTARPGVPDQLERFRAHEREQFRQPSSAAALEAASGGLVTRNFRVLGHLALPQAEVHADVAFFDLGGVGRFAFVGSWSGRCAGTGVKIVDVTRPGHPQLVTIAGSHAGESHEDIAVQWIGDRAVMVVGVQQCGEAGRSGMDLFDVTDPRHPERLSFFRTPPGGVHELDLVVRPGGRALALLAVPFVEFGNTYFGANDGGEFRIVDVTDPEHPRALADWGLIADSMLPIQGGNDESSSSFQGLGLFAAFFDHSVRAADRGMTAYASYWDAGILKFDISDPTEPRLLARTLYPQPADGDGHSMTPYDVSGHRFLLQNDEDQDPFAAPTITSSATGPRRFFGIEEPWAPTLLSDVGEVSGRVFDAGEGCLAADYRGAAGRVVLADSVDPFYVGIIEGWGPVPCTIGRQAVLAGQADAKAFVSNIISPDDAYPYFRGNFDAVQEAARGMPVVQVADIDDQVRRIRAALERGPVSITLTPNTPTHGYLRVFREDVGSDRDGDGVVELRQVGKFNNLPYVTGSLQVPPGTWTIHNTEVAGKRSYSSWYSNGIVALRLTTPAHPDFVGQFVPPASGRFRDVFGPPFPLVWGVAIDAERGVIYASDMRSGLWILKPEGRARPLG